MVEWWLQKQVIMQIGESTAFARINQVMSLCYSKINILFKFKKKQNITVIIPWKVRLLCDSEDDLIESYKMIFDCVQFRTNKHSVECIVVH
jgi:hypothetical protein